MHGIKHGDKIIDLTETTQEFFDEDEAINVFRIVAWIGRVFRVLMFLINQKRNELLLNVKRNFRNIILLLI